MMLQWIVLGNCIFLVIFWGWIFKTNGPRKEIDGSKDIFKFSSIKLVPCYVPTSNMWQVFFPHNRRYFQVCVFNCLLFLSVLVGKCWNLRVVLIFIIMSEDEYIFMFMGDVNICFLKLCVNFICPLFSIGFLYLSFKLKKMYIMDGRLFLWYEL